MDGERTERQRWRTMRGKHGEKDEDVADGKYTHQVIYNTRRHTEQQQQEEERQRKIFDREMCHEAGCVSNPCMRSWRRGRKIHLETIHKLKVKICFHRLDSQSLLIHFPSLSLPLSRHRIPFCAADAKLFGFRYRKECFSLVSLFIPLLLLFHFCNFCVPFTSTFLSPPVVPEMKKVFHPTKPYRNLITHSNRYEGIERWGRERMKQSLMKRVSQTFVWHMI